MSIDGMAAVRARRDREAAEAYEVLVNPIGEPEEILAVVEDRRGRFYFRWSYSTHTFSPWRLLGAVHADTDEDFSWMGLRGERLPVRVVSEGVPEARR